MQSPINVGRRSRMAVGFGTIMKSMHTDSNPAYCEVYSIQHYMIKFVSNLRQFGCVIFGCIGRGTLSWSRIHMSV